MEGLLRGPGGVEPGRYQVEVVDREEQVLARRLTLMEGEALPWERMLRDAGPQAWVSLGGVAPGAHVHLRRGGWVLGVNLGAATLPVSERSSWVVGRRGGLGVRLAT